MNEARKYALRLPENNDKNHFIKLPHLFLPMRIGHLMRELLQKYLASRFKGALFFFTL
jgi:hypothetical protein